jgi:hypothetical protein
MFDSSKQKLPPHAWHCVPALPRKGLFCLGAARRQKKAPVGANQQSRSVLLLTLRATHDAPPAFDTQVRAP